MTSKDDTMTDFNRLYPPVEESSRLLIGCRRSDYSASRISHAIEDCDAQVLNLNITSMNDAAAEIVIDLRVNLRNTASISRSLARYGYEVIGVIGANGSDDTLMRDRVNELLHYLEI